jgi:hypothetical protein
MAAINIPGFMATVLRNGAPVRFSGCSVGFTANKLGSQWSIDFPMPMVISSTDTWSIILAFAGYSRTLVSNALSELYGQEDQVNISTTKVSSQSLDTSENMDVLNNYGIPKKFCFINPEWLAKQEKSAHIDNGIVVKTSSGIGFFGARTGPPERYFDPLGKLPGKEHDMNSEGSYDYQCFYAYSHQDIARQICQMIGVQFRVNLPDIQLIDVCTFESGTKWFDAITANFLMWAPDIKPERDAKGNLVVSVEDVMRGPTGPAVSEIVYIDNASVESISRQLSRPSDSNRLVDHIIITGRKTKDTTTIIQNDQPDYSEVEIPAYFFEPSFKIESSFKEADLSKNKMLGAYTGNFGIGQDEYQVGPVKDTVHYLYYHEWKDGKKFRRIPVAESVHAYDIHGEVSKTVTTHYYGPDKGKVVKTTEEYYFLTNMPGSKDKKLYRVRCKTTLQNYVIKPLNLTLTKELIEDAVVYNEVTVNVGNGPETKRTDPKPLMEVLRSNPNFISKDSKTTQRIMEMTTYFKFTRIDRCDDRTLIKTDVSFNVLAKNLPQVNSQILDNPQRGPGASSTDKDAVFRREYTDPRAVGRYINGRGPYYHPAKTINHPDICTEEIAWAIAQRIFYRKQLALSPTQWQITLNEKVPITLDYTALQIGISDLTRIVNGEEVTIPGDIYSLQKVNYQVTTTSAKGGAKVVFNEQIVIGN